MKKILVLGAYGHVGRHVVMKSIEKLECEVIASGRGKEKLESLFNSMDDRRLHFLKLDAFDLPSLRSACEGVDVVVNCVGPYAMNASIITKEVISEGIDYVDFANEQSHYKSLKSIETLARDNNVMMVTGVGTSPGLSTMLFEMAMVKIGDIHEFEMYFAGGNRDEPLESFGSVMGAVVETGLEPMALVDGVQVKMPLGKEKKHELLPEPFGESSMVAFPTVDALIIPEISPVKTVRAYWDLGDIPPGFSTLIKMMRPQKSKLGYKIMSSLVKSTMKSDFKKMQKEGKGHESLMKVIARGKEQSWEGILTLPRGGGASASYLTLHAVDCLLSGKIQAKGLLLPQDLIKPSKFLETIKEFGWNGKFTDKIL
ncbi:MAG: saccharopine dehydrogenase family protein [Candidatus Hodarchaeota archaeon]